MAHGVRGLSPWSLGSVVSRLMSTKAESHGEKHREEQGGSLCNRQEAETPKEPETRYGLQMHTLHHPPLATSLFLPVVHSPGNSID